ncbi:hypothetical protein CONPUDRAFT_166347 [Coniophora puteana RWD-64-598 SS2]|uniref:Uncharacterized protein n=1 Tax=Coniophora puteana (strain RWD-64-598) TaxID=741705 RepID=A0A5M3MK42_CONPW|nr:uncharacterized protein CONPUDRAFT_166347 [Coniophora puteana RWD-64-598 SS2]EIW79599.1 hypothetical protein CONPUDRAFT_166347 [Coniophora puteana RWD-64-598 SS2]
MRFGGFFIPMPVVVEWGIEQPELAKVLPRLFVHPAWTDEVLICTNKHALNYACGTTLLRRLKTEYTRVRAGFGATHVRCHIHTHTHAHNRGEDRDGCGGGGRFSDADGLFIATHTTRFSDRKFGKIGRDVARMKQFAMGERDEAIAGLIEREFPGFKAEFVTTFVPDTVGRAW